MSIRNDRKALDELLDIEQQLRDWVKFNPDLNFQANPTAAINAVIHEAILAGSLLGFKRGKEAHAPAHD